MSGGNFSLEPRTVPIVNSKHRNIVTKIPVPESLPILKSLDEYESTSMHGQLPIVWDRAEDYQVYDAWGNKWIDFTSTIFVANAGHGNPRIVEAIREYIDRPLLHSYTYATEIRADYIKYLVANTPAQFEKAFLLSAGTEATECAMKLMRMNGWRTGKKRPGIICFEGNWHGRTLGAQMMGYNQAQKTWIGYLDPNIYHMPFPYMWRAEAQNNPRKFFRDNMAALLEEHQLTPDDLCGFMLETYQGWAAAFYPPEFAQEVESFARENGMLLAFDEMQSGFGRTGELFGFMHYGVEPDLICCGKGASSSLPLSIVLGRREIMDLPEIGSMSSTHSANPLVCAAGKANLEALLKDGLIDKAQHLGQVFHTRLKEMQQRYGDYISYVFGVGLVAGLIFTDPTGKPLSELCTNIAEKAMDKGLLVVHTGRESIKLAPPLTISEEALLEGLSTLEEAIAECIGACR